MGPRTTGDLRKAWKSQRRLSRLPAQMLSITLGSEAVTEEGQQENGKAVEFSHGTNPSVHVLHREKKRSQNA